MLNVLLELLLFVFGVPHLQIGGFNDGKSNKVAHLAKDDRDVFVAVCDGWILLSASLLKQVEETVRLDVLRTLAVQECEDSQFFDANRAVLLARLELVKSQQLAKRALSIVKLGPRACSKVLAQSCEVNRAICLAVVCLGLGEHAVEWDDVRSTEWKGQLKLGELVLAIGGRLGKVE